MFIYVVDQLNIYAHPRTPLPVHGTEFHVQLLPYWDISLMITHVVSPSPNTLSKLYINTNQLSYTEYGVAFRV